MIHQQFFNWQQPPQQGATASQSPMTSADEAYLAEVLIECRVRLESALKTAQTYSKLSELQQAIADAVTGCDEGVRILNDLEVYTDG